MRKIAILILSVGFISNVAFGAYRQPLPHVDPEMTGPEYLYYLEHMPQLKSAGISPLELQEDNEIAEFLAIGKRNLQWVDLVNASRDEAHKISLSSPATQAGNPVSSPRTYNFRIIKDRWDILKALLPTPIKKVLLENAPLSANPGVTDREFIEWLFQVDSAYQIAARYKMMKPYQAAYTQNAAYDVRGYLDLKEEENLDSTLNGWNNLDEYVQKRLANDLVMICSNAEKGKPNCESELSKAIKSKTVLSFKNKYFKAGQDNYNYFFTLVGTRSDATWTPANELSMSIPFANPHNAKVLDFLKTNIEDEWKWNGWQLHLNFEESSSPYMTHVVFVPGAVPHVESAPGSTITMDDNAPLSEYDVRWTIRHEYGHVLGFPDCYMEFYDQEQEAFVSYQLDVTNLMCSRRGKLKQTHFDELKRGYFKQATQSAI